MYKEISVLSTAHATPRVSQRCKRNTLPDLRTAQSFLSISIRTLLSYLGEQCIGRLLESVTSNK